MGYVVDDSGCFRAGSFKPTSIPGCILLLPSSAYTLAGGTLTGHDQSGHGNDCVLTASAVTIQPAAGGLPGYLDFPGAGNQTLAGAFSPVVASGARTLFISWRTPVGGNGFQLFDLNSAVKVDHDGSGSPDRTYVVGGGFLIDNGDSLTTAHVTTLTHHDSPSVAGVLYRDGIAVASGALSNALGNLASYLIGGPNQFSGANDAREIYKVCAFDSELSAPNRALIETYMLTPGD